MCFLLPLVFAKNIISRTNDSSVALALDPSTPGAFRCHAAVSDYNEVLILLRLVLLFCVGATAAQSFRCIQIRSTCLEISLRFSGSSAAHRAAFEISPKPNSLRTESAIDSIKLKDSTRFVVVGMARIRFNR